MTEGTALRFTVESSYTEILDAGYVPKLTATTLNADNTTSTKVLYDPADDTFAELNRYLHMRFYKQTEGKDGKKKSTRPTLIQRPILTKIIWGLSFRILRSMPADGKRRRKPGRSA